jgi:hypothetical protein
LGSAELAAGRSWQSLKLIPVIAVTVIPVMIIGIVMMVIVVTVIICRSRYRSERAEQQA